MQFAGRWESVTMPGRYASGQLAARGAVAQYLVRARLENLTNGRNTTIDAWLAENDVLPEDDGPWGRGTRRRMIKQTSSRRIPMTASAPPFR